MRRGQRRREEQRRGQRREVMPDSAWVTLHNYNKI